jgi:hypothetical protein
MVAIRCSKISVLKRATRRNILEDSILEWWRLFRWAVPSARGRGPGPEQACTRQVIGPKGRTAVPEWRKWKMKTIRRESTEFRAQFCRWHVELCARGVGRGCVSLQCGGSVCTTQPNLTAEVKQRVIRFGLSVAAATDVCRVGLHVISSHTIIEHTRRAMPWDVRTKLYSLNFCLGVGFEVLIPVVTKNTSFEI